jgi:putative GTP pyrophosphokinase
MNDAEKRAELLKQYDVRRHVYEGLLSAADRLVSDLLRIEQIRVLSVTGRVKERLSLSEKLGRPEKDYKELSDITDLVGLRVVTFFEDDVDRVAELIARELELVPDHCVDKRATLEPDRFGYRSLHYVCRLSRERRALFENAGFQDQVIEIQIRSILQHAWAEIEHDLGYKGEITIPNEIKRQLSRVSGLLEIADRDFREVRDRSAAYRQRVADEISRNELSGIDLDVISFGQFISTSPLVLDLNHFLNAELGYTVDEGMKLSYLLGLFRFVGVNTAENLKDQVEINASLLKEYARIALGNASVAGAGIPRDVSLFHLAQILALQNGGEENLAKMYNEFAIKSREKDDDIVAAMSTRSILNQARAALARVTLA